MSLAAFDERGKQQAFPVAVIVHDEGYYLLVGVPYHRLPGSRGIGRGRLCVKKPEEIVDFGDCPHG